MGKATTPLIYLIDDDTSVRQAIKRLLGTAGFKVEAFGLARTFLDSPFRRKDALLIADIHMPDMDGLELQEELIAAGVAIPVIFITAYDDTEKRDQASKLGAAAYFRKPVDGHALIDAIEWAFSNIR